MGVVAVGVTLVLGGAPAAGASSGSISGRVTDSAGNPLSGICASVENGPGDQTDVAGTYAIAGLETGSYKISYSDCDPTPQYVSQWFLGHADSGSADAVSVADGVDTPLADVALVLGVAVSGTVTDTNGAAIAGISVNMNPVNQGMSTGTHTDAAGHYTTSPLPPADYRVQFSDNGPTPVWARQYWSQKLSWNNADTLTLTTTDGPVHAGVDAQLTAAATVQGTVTGPGATPISGVCVDANVATNGGGYDWVQGTTTTTDGTYTLGQLPATELRIHFRDCNGGGLLEQWYDAKPDFSSATPLVLAGGDARQGVDAQLAAGVSVAGRVTDTNGNPLAGISVNVNPSNSGSGGWAQTDANGDYTTTGVVAGTYRVQFSAPGPNPAWATQYWNAQVSWNNADILTVTAGDAPVLGGIDASLTAAASVAGTVTAPDGAPVEGICVNALVDSPNGPDWVGNATTASDGTYSIGALPAAAVKIGFQDCNAQGPYIEQWWNDQPDYNSATAISLVSGQSGTGIDAQLVAAGAIAGTVTDTGSKPLAGICVQATTSTFVGGLARTDSNGDYSIILNKPGAYRIQFVDCNDTPVFAGQWWDNQASMATAQTVTVALGQTVKSVNAALVPGALSTISGKVVNLHGIAVTAACVIAYVPNQYAIFAPVNPDGTYTLAGLPSGTYALAFLGCNGENPSATVPDPEAPGTSYHGVWWNGVPLDLDQNNNGGPDPIAQGANLVTVTPGQTLTGYDWCFGCTAISIETITPGTGTLTVAFTTPGLVTNSDDTQGSVSARANDLVYIPTCTSSNGEASSAAVGSSSVITVTGLDPGNYTCIVTAADGPTTVASSAVSEVVAVSGPAVDPSPASPTVPGPGTRTAPTPEAAQSSPEAALAFTGTNSTLTLVPVSVALICFGLGCVVAARRRRAPNS